MQIKRQTANFKKKKSAAKESQWLVFCHKEAGHLKLLVRKRMEPRICMILAGLQVLRNIMFLSLLLISEWRHFTSPAQWAVRKRAMCSLQAEAVTSPQGALSSPDTPAVGIRDSRY